MKKLLSLLSVLSISGAAVPTTIAASPYPKEKKLNRLKRNNELSEKKLDVNKVIQQNNYWCGPAVGEMILRYFGLEQENNSNNFLNQENLSFRMGTNRVTWTNPIGFTNAINNWIGNRLNGRLYSNISLRQLVTVNFGERFRIFFNIIRNSLSNNMPVAIGNYGRDLNPQNSNIRLQRHFLLFTGYSRGNEYDPQNVIYHYIDPGDGQSYSVTANSFFESGNLDTMNAWIIANIDQNLLSQNSLVDEYYDSMELETNFDPTVLEESCPIIFNPHLNFGSFGKKRNTIIDYKYRCYLSKNKKTIFEKIKNSNIKEKITVIKVLDKNNQGGNLKSGTIYVGTDNGVYLIYPDGKCHKFDNLNFPITSIKLDGSGSAYVTNNQEKVYHLNLVGWGSEKLEGIESSNLEKELKLYYDNNKIEKVVENNWYNNPNNKLVFKTFNVLKSDPTDNYKKIEFLGSDKNFKLTRTSWGAYDDYWYDKKLSDFNGQNYTNIITNLGEIKTNWNDDDKLYWSRLQSFKDNWGGSSIEGTQSFGLNYYREHRDRNFYLQFLIRQYATCWASSIGGSQFMGIGKGIRLYND